MFPLNNNDEYIDANGKRQKLSDTLGSGGGTDLPEYDESDAGKVLTVGADGLEWDGVFPEYDSSDAGKVLSVNNSGSLEWSTPATVQNRYESVGFNFINSDLTTSAKEVTT